MATQTPEMKGRKGAVIITLIIVAIVAAGIFWYLQSNNGNEGAYNTEKLSENLKGIDEQDKKYATVTSIKLQPTDNVEEQYQVLRPLEEVAADSSQSQANGSTLTAKEAYALGKNSDDGKTLYNASFLTYELSGDIASKSTDQIFKSQLDAVMAQAKQNQQSSNATVSLGEPKASKEITFNTVKGEKVQLASSQFEQTLTVTKDGAVNQKKILLVAAAAKFGNQLLFVTGTFANEDDFMTASEKLQTMASLVRLQLSEG